ncbi:uncharacterized protein LOC105736175 [Apis florea]|uniref:uncharacterized protein LOC105736175 n=1 Tax=Apis florea TaxID=7463 RepID=UPI0012FF243B|nr:uncharacterized protein LOC105736175 [Apis florea]
MLPLDIVTIHLFKIAPEVQSQAQLEPTTNVILKIVYYMDRAVVADLVIKKERLAAEMEYLVLLPVSVPIMLNHPLSVAIQIAPEVQSQAQLEPTTNTCSGNGIFSAPPGVSPHHVKSSIIRRNTKSFLFFSIIDGSRLIFVWPQKPPRSRLLRILAPLMHGILIGFLFMDAIHLWPGEFLPTSLPSIIPVPLPPVKCNVIEPRWFDNS